MGDTEGRAQGPERIWLQPNTDDYERDWTWCWHPIEDDADVEYVRAARVDALVEALRDLVTAFEAEINTRTCAHKSLRALNGARAALASLPTPDTEDA